MSSEASVAVANDPVGHVAPHDTHHVEGPVSAVYEVFVSYNGVDKPFKVTAIEPVQVLLNAAILEFHVTAQPHTLSLYNTPGTELPDAGTLRELGVKPDDHLLMRPSAVKGG